LELLHSQKQKITAELSTFSFYKKTHSTNGSRQSASLSSTKEGLSFEWRTLEDLRPVLKGEFSGRDSQLQGGTLSCSKKKV
jgi:hypothetical protein